MPLGKRKERPEKRNEYLDASDSEADSVKSDKSGQDELRKGGRPVKRRRSEDEESANSFESDDDLPDENDDIAANNDSGLAGPPVTASTGQESALADEDGSRRGETDIVKKMGTTPRDLPDVSRPLLKKNLVVTEAAIKKSGVIYLGKIPPYMKPSKLRSLLAPFGTINRLYLVPEDPKVRTKRVRNRGNKKTCYTEGWVEFTRKKVAKQTCELLNGRTIGGKKSSYYRDDVWSMIYLKGFKWHHLTEQIAQENAERTARLRADISRTTKENKEFVRNVETAKMLESMQTKAAAKTKAKTKAIGVDGQTGEGDRKGGIQSAAGKARSFKQIPLAKKRREVEEQPEQVARVLSKIF